VEILIRQRDVDDDRRLVVAQQAHELRHVVGIDLRGADLPPVHLLDLRGELLAARDRAAGEHHVFELLLHRRFVRDDSTDAAGSDDQDLGHARSSTTV
jgi:hypothetical protein